MEQLSGLVKDGRTQVIFSMLTIKRTDTNDIDFQWLVKQLDKELSNRYGEIQLIYDQYDQVKNLETVVVAYAGETPVGCGCFKNFDSDTAELKRMYVADEWRSKGIGAFLVNELEKWAKELKFSYIVLETGTGQPEAIRLYTKLGYKKIPNYEQYSGMDTSICFKKEIN